MLKFSICILSYSYGKAWEFREFLLPVNFSGPLTKWYNILVNPSVCHAEFFNLHPLIFLWKYIRVMRSSLTPDIFITPWTKRYKILVNPRVCGSH